MAIGDGEGLGGLGLSIGLSLNITGFEQLAGITQQLEMLQAMALKTQEAFDRMGAAFTKSMSMGGLEATRARGEMDRLSRSGSGQSAVQGSAFMGTRDERFAANYENTDVNLRQRAQARAMRDSERAIRDETEARRHSWDGLKTGIMGALGVSAGLGVIEIGRSFVEAAAKMDDRRASMRLQGLNPATIAQDTSMALHANVPGLDLNDKMQLGQQIGTAVGIDKVTPDAIRTIAVSARAITQLAGGDMKENIDRLVQASQSAGNLVDANGLSSGRLANNSMAVEHIMALAPGRFSLEHLNDMLGASRAGLQGLDVAGNKSLQADLALLGESKGVNPKNLNQALRFLQGGVEGNALGPLAATGMVKVGPGGLMPSVNPMTGKSVLKAPDILNIPNTGNPLDFYRVWADRAQAQHPNVPIQNLINSTFPTDVARIVSSLVTPTAREEHQRNVEGLERQPQGVDQMLLATASFNQALRDVEKAWSEFAQVLSPTLTQDAAKVLEMVASGLHGLSVVLAGLGPVLPILTRVIEMLAMIAALRLGGRLLGAGAGVGGRLLGIGAGAAGGGAVGAAEGLAVGALAGRAMSGAGGAAAKTGIMAQALDPQYAVGGALVAAKMGAMKMAGRGLTAMLVSGIADSVVDTFTTEGSDTNTLVKDAIEGSAIGATVAGWPGAIIGAIVDPLVKHVIIPSAQNFDEMNKQTMKDNPTQPYIPMGPEPMMPVPGFTNADALGLPAIDQKEDDARERSRSKFVQGMAVPPTPSVGAHPAPNYTQSRVGQQGVEGNAPHIPLPTVGPHATQRPSDLRAIQQGMQHQSPPLGGSLPPSTPSFASPSGMPRVAGAAGATMPQMGSLSVNTIHAGSLIVGSTAAPGGSPGAAPAAGPMGNLGLVKNPDGSVGTPGGGGLGRPATNGTQSGSGTPGTAGGPGGTGIAGPMGMAAAAARATNPTYTQSRAGQQGTQGNGMPASLAGSSAVAAPFSSAQQKAAASDSVKFWMGKGLNKAQASGMAAQEIAESGGNPRAIGDGGLAHGLYQEHPDRIAAIKAGTGIDMMTADAQHQREGAYWEMTHTEKNAWKQLNAATTPQQAGAAGSMFFERPADRLGQAASRGALAGRIDSDVPNVQGPRITAEQADVPASQTLINLHSHTHLDGDEIGNAMATHIIGGGPTSAAGISGYDTKAMPYVPGTSPISIS